MRMTGRLNGKVEYRSLAEQCVGGEYGSEYDVFVLDRVSLREASSCDESLINRGKTVVYFFPKESVCISSDGCVAEFPRFKPGDLCVLDGGRLMRVCEVRYMTDPRRSSDIEHIKLILK